MRVSHCHPSLLALAGIAFALAFATNSPAQTVTDFSNFSESGNLLTGTNTREQSFTPGVSPAGSVTVANVSGSNVGQETFLSAEFPTLTTGDRISVNLTSATFNHSADSIGLAIGNTETPTSRTNILVWGWRSGTMYLTNFDAAGANTSLMPASPVSGRPDSVFIERTATGWTLGSIKGSTETMFYTNIVAVGSTAITTNGSAIGFWSDMRTTTSTWTVGNMIRSNTPPPPPPPPPPDYLPLVSFIPVTDSNEATDENGYAGSAINSIAFAQNNLITIGGQQFITYYRRHATDSNHPSNNTVVVARRNVGESQWEIFPTHFTSFNINDTHNVISMAIDGDGVMHMSWGMHVNTLLYARSTGTVLGDDPIVMTSLGTTGMTGQETSVTYPKFQTLPDGDVLFLFREVGSGNGDWYLNRYDTATDTWSPVHTTVGGLPQPLMLGLGDTPNNCFYPDRITLGPDGMLHLAGVFRYGSDSLAGETGYQTNHRYVYLRSPDGGTTWQRSDGSAIALPVVEAEWFQDLGSTHVPEIVKDLAEGHSIMNESGMTTDSAGRPIIANWWADNASTGNHIRQYHILFHNGSQWQQRTVSARDLDSPATKYSESQLGSSQMGRPVVLTDAEDRIIVLYNDNRFLGITVVFSEPLAQDPTRNKWTRMNLTHENLGSWEGTYDETRWKQDGVLHMLYQKLPAMGMSYSSQNNSTPVSVLEWDAHAYFNSQIQWTLDTMTAPGQATVLAPAYAGFRYDLRTSNDLDFSAAPVETIVGDGTMQDFGSWLMNEPRRFWRLERTEEATNDL